LGVRIIGWERRLTNTLRYLFSEKRTIEEVQGYCNSNAKDIIAIGFDPAKTFIFSDVCAVHLLVVGRIAKLTEAQFDYVGGAFYRNIVRLSKHITLNQARAIFGFNESSNIGRIHFGSIQGALELYRNL
jgi:tryptophanyl-tRNA synthetase